MERQNEMDEMESQDEMEPKEDKYQGEVLVCRDQGVCKLVQLLGYSSCFSAHVGDTGSKVSGVLVKFKLIALHR